MHKKGLTLLETLITSVIVSFVLTGVGQFWVFGIELTEDNYINSRIVQMRSSVESTIKNDIRGNAILVTPSDTTSIVILSIISSETGLAFPVVEYRVKGNLVQRASGDGSSAFADSDFRNFINRSNDKEKSTLQLNFNNVSGNTTDFSYKVGIEKLNDEGSVVKKVETASKTLVGYRCRTTLATM